MRRSIDPMLHYIGHSSLGRLRAPLATRSSPHLISLRSGGSRAGSIPGRAYCRMTPQLLPETQHALRSTFRSHLRQRVRHVPAAHDKEAEIAATQQKVPDNAGSPLATAVCLFWPPVGRESTDCPVLNVLGMGNLKNSPSRTCCERPNDHFSLSNLTASNLSQLHRTKSLPAKLASAGAMALPSVTDEHIWPGVDIYVCGTDLC